LIAVAFVVQGMFGGAVYSQQPTYLSERFPTEVRATAIGFCFHQGSIFGGFVPLPLTFFGEYYKIGLAIPMLAGTVVGATGIIISLLMSPETRGKELVADLAVA
jgi:SHS family lactate transporter-like MFS transporter